VITTAVPFISTTPPEYAIQSKTAPPKFASAYALILGTIPEKNF
jgi:hypothetical protein